jgi:uncharacterized protein (DUF4415 family)
MKNKKIENIDYSDIPETSAHFWKSAQIHVPDKKKSLTIRIDPDVLAWFQGQGKGYQTRINCILKTYVAAQRHDR